MKWKHVLKKLSVILGAIFVTTEIAAKLKKASSIYENELEQKNPLEGKKVIFVEDEDDKENADGIRGHSEMEYLSHKKHRFQDSEDR